VAKVALIKVWAILNSWTSFSSWVKPSKRWYQFPGFVIEQDICPDSRYKVSDVRGFVNITHQAERKKESTRPYRGWGNTHLLNLFLGFN
jgi:hypothetical protein